MGPRAGTEKVPEGRKKLRKTSHEAFAIVDPKTKQKAIYFILALARFGIVAGSDLTNARIWRLTLCYVGTAIFAFWIGGEPIGVLRPLSMRPLCIVLGVGVMVCIFIMMLLAKDALRHLDRTPNDALQRPGIALRWPARPGGPDR